MKGKRTKQRFHQNELWNNGDRLKPLRDDPCMVDQPNDSVGTEPQKWQEPNQDTTFRG